MTNRLALMSDKTKIYRVLVALVALDVLFIGLFIARDFLLDTSYSGFLQSELWLIEEDRSYPEIYQYLKVLLMIAMFGLLYLKRRSVSHLAWLLALLFVVLDDALQWHETFGAWLIANFELPTVMGVGSDLYAEAVLWLAAGLPLASLVVYGYLRDHSARAISRGMLYLFLGLALFAGVLDSLHTFVERSGVTAGYARGVTTTIEDGGEMLVLSLMVAFVFIRYLRARQSYEPSGPKVEAREPNFR